MIKLGGTKKPTAQDVRDVRNVIAEWVHRHMPLVSVNNQPIRQVQVLHNNSGDVLLVRSKFFNETLSKNIHNPKLAKTIEIATKFEEWMPNMTERPKEKGIHHPYPFRVFETRYEGYRIQMKAKENNGENLVYTMRILP